LLTHIATRTAEANVALAEQRQVLLMELQHRIKNHLQLMGAMLATHARATTNERIRARLIEAGQRLQVIAATYDNLYEPGALIDMSEHLRKLCAFVEGGVADRTSKITVDTVATRWPVERVIPLSLIANELLTNAVKYAAPDRNLEVDVKLERQDGRMLFSVLTRGTTLPAEFSLDGPGLGLRIAATLAASSAAGSPRRACPTPCSSSSSPNRHASARSPCRPARSSPTFRCCPASPCRPIARRGRASGRGCCRSAGPGDASSRRRFPPCWRARICSAPKQRRPGRAQAAPKGVAS
jgi:two-component sensor histidine kinase